MKYLRIKAFPWIPGTLFDEALKEARKYHEDHPPLECVSAPTVRLTKQAHIDVLEEKKDLVEEVNQVTIESLLKEHRKQIMLTFQVKGVPEEVAGLIADQLVLPKPN